MGSADILRSADGDKVVESRVVRQLAQGDFVRRPEWAPFHSPSVRGADHLKLTRDRFTAQHRYRLAVLRTARGHRCRGYDLGDRSCHCARRSALWVWLLLV
jgi:hypothetical protein